MFISRIRKIEGPAKQVLMHAVDQIFMIEIRKAVTLCAIHDSNNTSSSNINYLIYIKFKYSKTSRLVNFHNKKFQEKTRKYSTERSVATRKKNTLYSN